MNLRKVDLNLLLYFDALMQTRHVSRAASMIGVGQPAMSSALGRLRDLFEDPLLVRQGHDMVPTARALALEPEIKNVLRGIAQVVEPPGDFVPAESKRTFRLRMSDLLTYLALPDLGQVLEAAAPGIGLTVDHFAPEKTVDALTGDRVDLAISTGLDIPKSVRVRDLMGDTVVCVARRDMDMSRILGDPEVFARTPQVRVSQSPLDDRFTDRNLGVLGLDRNVAMTVPHWLAVPEILCATSLVAAVPATFARRISARYPLAIGDIGFFDTGFTWSMYWHHRYASDPAHTWLRARMAESCIRQLGLAAGGAKGG